MILCENEAANQQNNLKKLYHYKEIYDAGKMDKDSFDEFIALSCGGVACTEDDVGNFQEYKVCPFGTELCNSLEDKFKDEY